MSRARPDVPHGLETVIYRATRRTPDERYASAAEMASDLAHLDALVPPLYQPDIAPPRPVGDLPPWRLTASILLVVLLVLVLVAVGAQYAHGSVHLSPVGA